MPILYIDQLKFLNMNQLSFETFYRVLACGNMSLWNVCLVFSEEIEKF